ncbi:hypothetical protein MTYM_00055 [Methylococcales bacterium]|nr:hypothetical protein MTYM_00055 [Methylococcales bacterium]
MMAIGETYLCWDNNQRFADYIGFDRIGKEDCLGSLAQHYVLIVGMIMLRSLGEVAFRHTFEGCWRRRGQADRPDWNPSLLP